MNHTETEIKLSPVDPPTASRVFADRLLAPYLSEAGRSDMESVYYSCPGGSLSDLGAALRLRMENGSGVCCLKIKSGFNGQSEMRYEYEVPAATIEEGAAKLSEIADIPDDIASLLLAGKFIPECGCSFTRTEARYTSGSLSFALSYDIGEYYRGDVRAPLGELELELKEGRAEDMNAVCAAITEKYGLEVCRVSKYASAMALGLDEEKPTGGEEDGGSQTI